MTYLDFDRLEAIEPATFQNQKPFPWINPQGLLTDQGFQRLVDNLPDVSLFKSVFGLKRSHGQQSHDRYALEYSEDVKVPQPWQEFIEELNGRRYRAWLNRLFGRGLMKLNFHWHYTPNGCSVSPHCDAKRKIGSHIFYLNTEKDWDQGWGGETVVLDDGGRFKRNSAPEFEEFMTATGGEALGNYSLLFKRQGNSWHGVREIHCPEGSLRKVFIVVINDRFLAWRRRFVARLRGERIQDY